MRCMITASLRATATRARLAPRRRAMATPQARSLGWLTQRYVHGQCYGRRSAGLCRLLDFRSPQISLRLRDDFWGWNADGIAQLFVGEVVFTENWLRVFEGPRSWL